MIVLPAAQRVTDDDRLLCHQTPAARQATDDASLQNCYTHGLRTTTPEQLLRAPLLFQKAGVMSIGAIYAASCASRCIIVGKADMSCCRHGAGQ